MAAARIWKTPDEYRMMIWADRLLSFPAAFLTVLCSWYTVTVAWAAPSPTTLPLIIFQFALYAYLANVVIQNSLDAKQRSRLDRLFSVAEPKDESSTHGQHPRALVRAWRRFKRTLRKLLRIVRVALLLGSGAALATTSVVFVIMHVGSGERYFQSFETARRTLEGGAYWAFRFIGLDHVGFILGTTVFYGLISFGCLCCGLCCGFGHWLRNVRKLLVWKRAPPPFMDLVQNRSRSGRLDTMLILLPFCLVSSYLLGSTLLVLPSRIFRDGGPPAQLLPLCTPVVTEALNRVMLAGFKAATNSSDADDMSALSLVFFHSAWRSVLEPIDASCAADGAALVAAASRMPAHSASLPPLAFVVRDEHGSASNFAACLHAGTQTDARNQTGLELPFDSVDTHGRCARLSSTLVAVPMGCSGAWLEGSTDSAFNAGRFGLAELLNLVIVSDAPLCEGDYLLRFAALENATAAGSADPPGSLRSLDYSVRVVPYQEADVIVKETTLGLPSVTDIATGDNVTGSIIHRQSSNLTTVVTEVVKSVQRTQPDGAVVDDLSTNRSVREPAHMIFFLTSPPTELVVHQSYTVTLKVSTESGLPLPAQAVQAALLAPEGTTTRLRDGAYAYTDSQGVANLTFSLESGTPGNSLLIFASTGTVNHNLQRKYGAAIEGLKFARSMWGSALTTVQRLKLSVEEYQRVVQGMVESEVERAVRQVLEQQKKEVEACAGTYNHLNAARVAILNATAPNATEDATATSVGLDSSGAQREDFGFQDASVKVGTTEISYSSLMENGVQSCYDALDTQDLKNIASNVDNSTKTGGKDLARRVLNEALATTGLGPILGGVQLLAQGDQSILDTSRTVTSIFSTAQSGADTPEERMRLLRQLVQLALGPGAPPPFNVTIRNRVTTAELTAPLVGYGLVPTASASITSPWETFRWWDTGGFCMRSNQLNYLPQQQEGRAAFPIDAPLWQAPLLLQRNWLLDSTSFLPKAFRDKLSGSRDPHYDTPPPHCYSSFIANGQPLPGTVALFGEEAGTLGVTADGWAHPEDFEEGAAFLESLSGDVAAYVQACVDNRTEGNTSLRMGCALGGALGLGRTNAAGQNMSVIPPPLWISGHPRVIARDQNGAPVPDRTCRIRVVDAVQLLEIESLTLSYTCGPSGADGMMSISHLRIEGGSTRPIRLIVDVDGVEAVLDPNRSQWHSQLNALYYFNSDQLSWRTFNLIIFQGHESIVVLALLALPMFAVNSVGFPGALSRLPKTSWLYFGALSMLLFTSLSVCLLLRLHGPPGTDWASKQRVQLTAVGLADTMAFRAGTANPLQVALTSFAMVLTVAILVLMTWLLAEPFLGRWCYWVRCPKGCVGLLQSCWRCVCCEHPFRKLRGCLKRRGKAQLEGGEEHLGGGTSEAAAAIKAPRRASVSAFSSALQQQPGDLEQPPRWWLDEAAQKRERAARNHVRLLLRGGWWLREWQEEQRTRAMQTRWGRLRARLFGPPKVDFHDCTPFFFPLRLQMAATVSIWVQFLLSVLLFVTVEWMRAAVKQARHLEEQLAAEAAYSSSIDSIERFSPSFRLLMLSLHTLYLSRPGARHLDTILIVTGIVSAAAQYSLLVANWTSIFWTYRKRAIAMRKGQYFFDPLLYREEHSNKFLGFQIAAMTLCAPSRPCCCVPACPLHAPILDPCTFPLTCPSLRLVCHAQTLWRSWSWWCWSRSRCQRWFSS